MEEWQWLVAEIGDPRLKTIEINGSVLVSKASDRAVLPWHQQQASQVQVKRLGLIEEIEDWSDCFQVIVHVDKSRQASLEAVCYAWWRLPEQGSLYLCGSNQLGIKGTVKQVQELIGQEGEVLLNKMKARVQHFKKPKLEQAFCKDQESHAIHWQQVDLSTVDEQQVWTRYGVFSADALDEGTALLQALMAEEEPAEQLVDMACGSGHLGLSALRQWPESRCLFLDADARAISCVEKNILELQLSQRARAEWWSAGAPFSAVEVDLVLMNPPAHSGKQQDCSAAFTMFRQAYACLRSGGRLYIIANRQLPYELDLKTLSADVTVLVEAGPFKIILLRK